MVLVGNKYVWFISVFIQAAIALLIDNYLDFTCDGSVISERWILTAAQCIPSNEIPLVVRLNTIYLKPSSDGSLAGKDVFVDRIVRHARYDYHTNYHNDIALLRLNESLSFTSTFRTACLNSDLSDPTAALWEIGWSRQQCSVSLKSSPIEYLVNLKYFPFSYRRSKFKYSAKIAAGSDESTQMWRTSLGAKNACRTDVCVRAKTAENVLGRRRQSGADARWAKHLALSGNAVDRTTKRIRASGYLHACGKLFGLDRVSGLEWNMIDYKNMYITKTFQLNQSII